MKIKTNIVKLLAVLAILGSLVAIAAVPASAVDASYSIPTPTGPVGSSVTIAAINFTAGQILTVKFDGAPMSTSPATVTVPAGGSISFTVIVPTTTGGPTAGHKIEVFRDGQTITTQDPIGFIVTSKVVITSPTIKSGSVGSSVTVAGTGFSGAGVTVDVTIGTAIPPAYLVSGAPVDNTGSFTATGVVPAVAVGAQPISAKDGAGNTATATDSFTVTPTLTLSPTSGLAGSKVTISGSGWKVSDSITMWFAGTQWDTDAVTPGTQLPTVTTDINGNINPVSVVTPSAGISPGVKTVAGYDTGSHQGTTTFTVVARALTVTPLTSGPRGTKLLITGANMTPSNPQATPPLVSQILANQLKMGNIGLNANVITIDTQGVISPTTVYVPAGAPLGVNTITATDNSGLVAVATFTVTQPSITINPATGPRGASVIVSGAGWLAPSTVLDNTVTVAFCAYGQKTPVFSNSKVTSIPDASGSFAAAITVPNVGAAGTYSIYASDNAGAVPSNEAELVTFTVPGAGITVSPASGVALDTITVTGTGFKPYWGITVSIGGYDFPTQVFSDVLGAFTFSGQVPGLAPGATVVGATDKTSTATTFFTLNVGAPTVKNQTASISSCLVRIWGYSGGTWSMYDPADAAGSNLATLTSGNGYWINVNCASTLVERGFSKALSVGWNLIGQP